MMMVLIVVTVFIDADSDGDGDGGDGDGGGGCGCVDDAAVQWCSNDDRGGNLDNALRNPKHVHVRMVGLADQAVHSMSIASGWPGPRDPQHFDARLGDLARVGLAQLRNPKHVVWLLPGFPGRRGPKHVDVRLAAAARVLENIVAHAWSIKCA